MNIEQKLYDAAVELIKQRYPVGWGGAAAMYTKGERILTSVAPEVLVDATNVCIETGAILEAHKFNDPVTYSICVVRDDENSKFKILTPCGICQERLIYWGEDVKAAVFTENGELDYKTLKEIQPYHWAKAYEGEI
ncbi:cytidine deaminase [Alicyclobacillus fastidiosus]|uniref:Cytidine deaminase n=1 Tax=Alicyclobacillus fastidiosus TaxID=392011 RepID=A0ABY6ZGN1_9BACL|nr:cytidine deaminase [Alicyclobacillus fastidiosus]WAH42009.1 cytidine deaminase [Alicyclobacillus fastidiosus]GMA63749.1 cytidine deaminase [Alicyclobacillus fastidiosus]